MRVNRFLAADRQQLAQEKAKEVERRTEGIRRAARAFRDGFIVEDYDVTDHGLAWASFFDAEIGGRVVHMRLLAPIFIVLEIPLDFARMLTLTVRLLANMYADHTVIVVWLSLAPIGVPAIFMGLGLVISFLQAFVFALLTMIYIGLALEDPH